MADHHRWSTADMSRQIIVTNFSEKCSEDILGMLFENRRTFGRELNVERVQFHEREGFAIVTFETSEDAMTAIELHKVEPLTDHGRQLNIEVYRESNAEDVEETKTVQVQDYNPNTSHDTFKYYFENPRISRGGPIQRLTKNEDSAYILITFKEAGVVEKVINQEHTLDGCKLQVNKFIVSKNEVLFTDLPPDASSDIICNFCEGRLEQDVVSATFSEDKSKILVSFKEAVDFRLAEKECKRCSIHNCYMMPHQVPVTTAIIVRNIDPESTRDDFWFYFENPRKGFGGEVQDVILKTTEGCCIVFFKDPKVVQSVCSKSEHKVRGSVLKVEPFNSCLGQPARFSFPDPVPMDTLDPYKLKFLDTHEKYKDELVKKLADVFASVSWESPFPKIECTLTSSVKDYKMIANSWTENVKRVIDDFSETVETREFGFEPDELDDVKKELRTLNIDHPEQVVVKVDTNNSKIVLIALKQYIGILSVQVKQVIDKAKEDCRQRKERKTEKKQFKPWNIRYLKAIGFAREMTHQFEQADIQLDVETCEVIITGTQRAILDIMVEVHSAIDQVNTQRLELEKGKIELLSNKTSTDKINKEMNKRGISDVWEVNGQGVCLYAEESVDLTRMKNVIEKMLTKISVDVDKKQKHLLSSKEWSQLKTRLCKEFHGCVVIEINDDKLEIYTIAENEESIDQQVKAFFSKNTVYKNEIPLDATKLKFIETYMKGDLDLEIRSVSKKGKSLTYKLHSSKVTIEGTAAELKAAQAVIKKLEEKVISQPYNLAKRGVYCYISSQKGKEVIGNVQRGCLVIIDIKGKGLGSSLGKGKENATEQNLNAPSHYAECVLKTGQKVVVYGGDMTELAVDVIVNASNKEMKHVGGLAAVIAKKGGWDIQKECDNHVQQNGPLSVSDVFMSRAGKLKCKAIAHVVGPVWHDGKQDEEKNLIQAVENCLRATENKQLVSIAMPALSSGMFGYPVDKACLVITQTVKAYFKKKGDSTITEVYLCDINRRTTQSFVEAAKITFQQCKILGDTGNTDGTVKQHAWLTESWNSEGRSSSPKTTAKCIPVKVIKGEITQEKVDVIVNSASSDLQLDKGKSSHAILEAGGQRIQDDCSNNYPSGIAVGQVAITTGGKLQCKKVFHVALEPYRKAQTMHPIQGLKKSMEVCLREADRQGYSSIAFPAMGTGAQGYPKDEVANEMFKCVADYFKRHGNSGLTSVHFVIFHRDDDIFETFVTKEKHWTGKDDVGYGSRVSTAGFGKIVVAKREYGEFDFGSIKVKVFHGDITEQKKDAIVASSNLDLDLTKGAVTKAIVKKGGPEIVQDCARQKEDMQRHGVAITIAGQLNAKYIIHIDTKYKLKEWEPMILKCLEQAEKHSFSSIAFPVLGTSVGCKPDDIARLFSSALTTFHKWSPKHLQRVSVVVFNKEMLGPFIDGMKSSIGSGSSRPESTKRSGEKHQSQHEGHTSRQPKQKNMDDVCSLNIYGIDDGRINQAIRQLEADVMQNWMTSRVDCTMLNELGKSRVDKIHECGKKNHVIVDFEEKHEKIALTGLPANIITVRDHLSKITREFDNSQHHKKLATLMKNIIIWFYIKNNKSFPFPDTENLKIETAYSEKRAAVRIKDNSGGVYEINFNEMKEWDISKPTDKFPVIRKDLMKDVGHETPKEWTMMREDQQLQMVQLQSSSKEYQKVQQHFVNTLGRQPQIAKIVRIQNVTLYRQYAAKKKQMDSTNPKQKNEQMLWHGTDVSALDSINNHGFNRSYCGKNATALGAGVYFAVNANYSDQGTYTPIDSSGHKHMYRARVLTGSYTTGNPGLRVPPVKDPNNPHILYDSVTNNVSNPMMYVVFNDTQAYPEHIITYK